jgi:hypothetical protein
VTAEDIEEGDRLLLDDGTIAEVADVRIGIYHFPEGRAQGVAIGWKSGRRASGLLFRRASDLLNRVSDGA